jgi:hypothetical protein
MPARWRKLIGGIGILIFLAVYVRTAVVVFAWIPSWPWLQLAYMATVGIVWGLPLIPLIAWMNRGR